MTYSKKTPLEISKTRSMQFNPITALRKTSRDFKNDRSGVAAIEFALIAPIMIGIYFGLAEVASAISVDRRVSHTANVVGDLATQLAEVDNDNVNEIFAAAIRVLDIKDINNVTIELASYEQPETEESSRVQIGIATLNKDKVDLPVFTLQDVDARILNQTSGVVVARIAYSYTPLQLRFTDANINLSETFLLKPRKSTTVPIGNDPNVPVDCNTTQTGINCPGTTTTN